MTHIRYARAGTLRTPSHSNTSTTPRALRNSPVAARHNSCVTETKLEHFRHWHEFKKIRRDRNRVVSFATNREESFPLPHYYRTDNMLTGASTAQTNKSCPPSEKQRNPHSALHTRELSISSLGTCGQPTALFVRTGII